MESVQALAQDADMHKKWRAFLRKMPGMQFEFVEVVNLICRFIGPVFAVEEKSIGNWNPKRLQFEHEGQE